MACAACALQEKSLPHRESTLENLSALVASSKALPRLLTLLATSVSAAPNPSMGEVSKRDASRFSC